MFVFVYLQHCACIYVSILIVYNIHLQVLNFIDISKGKTIGITNLKINYYFVYKMNTSGQSLIFFVQVQNIYKCSLLTHVVIFFI